MLSGCFMVRMTMFLQRRLHAYMHIHLCTHLFTRHSLTPLNASASTPSLTPSLTHSLTPSLTHSLTHSLTCLLTCSLQAMCCSVKSKLHVLNMHCCRLYERRKKMEAKLAAVRAAAEHPVDPATGRPFFQPAIGRGPHYRRNQHGLPVGDYLYGMR